MATDTVAVRIPIDLLERVDRLYRTPGFGYRSRSEFVIEAIRRRADEVEDGLARRGGTLLGALEEGQDIV